ALWNSSSAASGAWSRGLGLIDHTASNPSIGSPSARWTTGGLQGGYDHAIGERGLLGFSYGFANTNLQVDDRSSSGDSTARQVGIYAGFMPNSWFFNGSLGFTG